MREPGDLAPHKVPRSTWLKFQHHRFELGLHSLREKKSTLYGALSELEKICGVK